MPWFRGNLHTHTTLSDGRKTPEEVAEWYRSAGYHFIFITDHGKVTDFSHLCREDFLVLRGGEFAVGKAETGEPFHLVGLDLPPGFQLSRTPDVQEAINQIREAGGEVIIAHPYWSGLSWRDIYPLEGILGIEIFNNGVEIEVGKGHCLVHWDDLLERGKRLYGFAVDDAHFAIEDAGGGWIEVEAEELTREAIMEGIRKGNFYSSQGPRIFSFLEEGSLVRAETSPTVSICFLSHVHLGKCYYSASEPLRSARLEVTKRHLFVRVECRDENSKRAWSNPYYL